MPEAGVPIILQRSRTHERLRLKCLKTYTRKRVAGVGGGLLP